MEQTKYVVPFDLFRGNIKKGDIYISYTRPHYNNEPIGIPYNDFFNKTIGLHHLPMEIVSKWETFSEAKAGDFIVWLTDFDGSEAGHIAVIINVVDSYKYKKIYYIPYSKNGGWFNVGEDAYKQGIDFRLANDKEIENFCSISIAGYSVVYYPEYIQVGCKSFTFVEIQAAYSLSLSGIRIGIPHGTNIPHVEGFIPPETIEKLYYAFLYKRSLSAAKNAPTVFRDIAQW